MALSVGRYEIISELGRGAMGLVYKAKDPTIGRVVALKTMRMDAHGVDTEDMLARFKNEAQAVGLLNHPNIVTIYDAGEQDTTFYIAMEYIEGTTLHQLLAQKRVLATEEVIQFARQICAGLDYAQSFGIVHRDVKPANIMITSNGTVKIMDFGIAKTGGSVTSTGQVLGTPNYMSPEQVKGKQLDGRSDLFSFGVCLYEMLTGEKPFVGQNVTTIIYKIVNETPTSPRDLDVTIHPGLSAVVIKALDKSPDDRYQTGAELVRDLENYKSLVPKLGLTMPMSAGTAAQSEETLVLPSKVTGSAVRAPAPGPALVAKAPVALLKPAPAVKTKNHKGIFMAAIAAVLVLGLVAGFIYYRQRIQAQQVEEAQRRQQQQQAANVQVTKPSDTGTNEVVQEKPDQKPDPKPDQKKAKGPRSPIGVSSHQGELRFASQPDGAKVEVDGWSEPSWLTPFRASNLASGEHTVVFAKEGYDRETRTVTVTAGKSDIVSAQLKPAVSRIDVNSTPQNAAIWIDGRDTGKTTPAQIVVEKGVHKVAVRKPGFKDEIASPSLAEGQIYSFAPTLTFQQTGFWRHLLGGESIPEGKGVLLVRTRPEGATIILDGQEAPKKTDVRWALAPGTYDVVLKMDGFKTVHRTAQVEQGQVKSVDEILEKQGP
ncbi:MAG TPA: protein kinase [Verrucomicrobiae bacterium]|jgi:predicted Ser/Thr protein kinase|nr:protein kinase [Verrucomicrobiae bacterium]